MEAKKLVLVVSVLALVLVLAIASARIAFPRSNNSQSDTTTSSQYSGCVDASNEVSGISCSWLAQQAIAWKPQQNSSIGWSVVFTSASYDNIETTSRAAEQGALSMLLSSGASCIRIDVGYDAWLSNNSAIQNELENFTSQIQSAGKCLVLADASAEYYRSHPLSWSQFQSAWQLRVQALAAVFHPSFYILIKEPGWYVPMVSDARTNPQFQNASVWANLAENLANAVHSSSPGTKVGVAIQGGIPSNEQPFYVSFLKQVSQIQGIDFIGYDQYGANDMNLDLSLESQVQTAKAIWIAEAWSTDNPSIVFNPDRASLDAYWIQVLYYYAIYIHASMVEPFYTDAFASYSQPANYGLRTPVFFKFQHLAESYGTQIG